MSLVDTPEITVNGQRIAPSMIDAEIQYHPAESRRQAMLQAAQTLIIGELMRQRARELGLLAANTTADNDATEEAELFEQLIEREAPCPQTTDEECRRYYQAHQKTFCSAPLIEVRHILLASDPQDIDDRILIEEQAQELVRQLASGASFEEMAASYSACPSSKTGGQLGQLSKGQTVPEFERPVFAAEQGLMQRPVETRYGFHIVDILRKVEGEQLPYEAVEKKIAGYLSEKVRRKATAQYIEHLISRADIQGYQFEVSDSPLLQ